MPTTNQYNVTKQRKRNIYVKINLLNFNFQIVDELSGVVLSDTWTISSSSDIRRTGTITLTPTDSSFEIEAGNKIWLDKYIQPFIGIENIHTGEVEYTNMGIYLIDNPSQNFSSTDNTITIQLIDLMSKITGLRNGNLEGYEYQIKEGTSIREAIIGILKECGFNKYIIDIKSEDYQTVQYDISVSVGGTYYQLLTELNNMNVNYQIYFDVDGVFHYEKIPDGVNEQVIIDDNIWKRCYISHTVNTSFEDLKNSITVLGKMHDISNYCSSISLSGSQINATCSNVSALRNNLKVGFTTPDNTINSPSFNLNSYGAKLIKNENGTQPILEPNTYYVIKYKQDGDYWFFMGELQPMYIVEETNPNSPFYVNGTTGRIRIVLSGGEYDNINTTDLARQRAEWELYTRCRLLDSITLTCVPIYWADVNTLIEITLPNKTESQKYIIKEISITGGISGTQSIQMMKYYPYYETNRLFQ